ncbi:MAG: tRNA (adenosine(37)-N6)-threonylcarbamoyltransferase complex dimerization subunit type 1 TsaB [Blastocatellia bacterium]
MRLTTMGVLNTQDFKTSELKILALDSSSRATSLAVARGGTMLASSATSSNEKRSETLWSEIRTLLARVGMTLGEIDVFAVCIGPGGFTGLRVGLAAVKGLAAPTNKPVVGVTSLEAAAFSARAAPLSICAMVNAYKGEVYSQLFSFDRDGMPVATNEPMVSTLEKAIERVSGVNELVFVGDGGESVTDLLRRGTPENGERKWRVNRSTRPLAEDVASLAMLKYARDEVETALSLKARYVRRAEAEIKLSLGLLGSKIKRSMKSE